jgi:hypothetical protein
MMGAALVLEAPFAAVRVTVVFLEFYIAVEKLFMIRLPSQPQSRVMVEGHKAQLASWHG